MRAIWAIIPIKDLGHAKQRLSGMLREPERKALGLAMLEDLLIALAGVRALSGILLVSGDGDACDLARRYGARILTEANSSGLNPAVTRAAALLASEGVAGALVLHGDIPLATAQEVEQLIHALEAAPAIAIAPDSAHDGSNALAVSPPDLIAFRYGRQSFSAHLHEAAHKGVAPNVLDLPGLAFDVDEAEDLLTLASAPGNSLAQEFLRGLALDTRMPKAAAHAR